MHTPGAFTWWYADLVDENGNGMVLIWFFGLPFFPSKSLEMAPDHLGGLTLSVYKEGKLDFYAFQTYPPEGLYVNLDQNHWCLGNSTITLKESASETYLQASLNINYAGGEKPLIADLEVKGVRRNSALSLLEDKITSHVWSPMMLCAQGQFSGTIAGQPFRIEGPSYMDRNQSLDSIQDLGIKDWHWARISMKEKTWILYFLQDHQDEWTQHAFSATPDGQMALEYVQSFEQKKLIKDRYGIRWARTSRVELFNQHQPLELSLSDPLEHSPFYMRHVITAKQGDEVGHGVYERLVPSRISLKWLQPLMAMRINEWHRNRSMWLPLFEGTSNDRWTRLLRSFYQPKKDTELHLGKVS
ncbi:MAG: hypothetical protein CMH56_00495 [Myxococcales bacterium]|nr:hypothetical protein [Myxococcales bacterium]|tara:strand:+ start:13873 stop:14943 length:1071 start_codon:yes stop_codon:yes gene_type:complete